MHSDQYDVSRPPARTTQAELVIIGGGPTGHAALRAYRSAGGSGQVVMVSEDDTPPYSRPALSKDYLRGETDEQALSLAESELYLAVGNELLLAESVVALDAGARSVRTRTGREIGYVNCLLATGSDPAGLDVPGGDSALRLRWLDQARQLRAAAQVARTAVVIGSGFIGCEAAVALARRGIAVTMVSSEQRPQQARLGDAAADLIAGWLDEAGVRLHSGTEVANIAVVDPAVVDGTAGRIVRLSDGTALSTDLVLAAVGVSPRAELAVQAGLELRSGRVVVDECMRTAIPGLFAAGDLAMAYHAAAGRHLAVEHWGEAERMGEIAGTVAAGGEAKWEDPPGFWSTIGDHTLKYTAWGDGFDEATADEHDNGGLSIWYSQNGTVVGVLTNDADDDYERGTELVRTGSPVQPASVRR